MRSSTKSFEKRALKAQSEFSSSSLKIFHLRFDRTQSGSKLNAKNLD